MQSFGLTLGIKRPPNHGCGYPLTCKVSTPWEIYYNKKPTL